MGPTRSTKFSLKKKTAGKAVPVANNKSAAETLGTEKLTHETSDEEEAPTDVRRSLRARPQKNPDPPALSPTKKQPSLNKKKPSPEKKQPSPSKKQPSPSKKQPSRSRKSDPRPETPSSDSDVSTSALDPLLTADAFKNLLGGTDEDLMQSLADVDQLLEDVDEDLVASATDDEKQPEGDNTTAQRKQTDEEEGSKDNMQSSTGEKSVGERMEVEEMEAVENKVVSETNTDVDIEQNQSKVDVRSDKERGLGKQQQRKSRTATRPARPRARQRGRRMVESEEESSSSSSSNEDEPSGEKDLPEATTTVPSVRRSMRQAKITALEKTKKYVEKEKESTDDAESAEDSGSGDAPGEVASSSSEAFIGGNESDEDPDFVVQKKPRRGPSAGSDFRVRITRKPIIQVPATMKNYRRKLPTIKLTSVQMKSKAAPAAPIPSRPKPTKVEIIRCWLVEGEIPELVGGVMECDSEPFDESYWNTPTP